MNVVSFNYEVAEVPETPFPSGPVSRESVLALERAMFALPESLRVETPVTHHFSDGIYAREVFIPAGTVVTGKIHKREHLFMIIQGEVSILTETGVSRLTAPQIFCGRPGTKRAAFAHTDTICVAIHGTHETDLEKIEAEFIAQDYAELDTDAAILLEQLK